MKIIQETKSNNQYTVTYYQLEKCFNKTKRYIDYRNEIIYRENQIIHEGCYVKKWVLNFKDKKSLIVQIKKWYGYKKDNSISFFMSMKDALKNNNHKEAYFIIKKVGDENQVSSNYKFSINLKRKKKYNPSSGKKKSRQYYCDCFYCTKTTYDNYEKKKLQDTLKLN